MNLGLDIDGTIDEMSGTDTRPVHPGDVWVLETPGGGGYGKPGSAVRSAAAD